MSLKQLYSLNFFWVVLAIYSPNNYAQENNAFLHYDTLSYQLYQQEQWNELIKVSKAAYENGLDYYYLRMRTGIAYFNTGNYLTAKRHFTKALEFNKLDPVTYEYIYYCLLNTGREKEAMLVYQKHEESLKKRIELTNPFIDNLQIDLVYHVNSRKNQLSLSQQGGIGTTQGYQSMTKDFLAGDFLLNHIFTGRFSLFHGPSILMKNNEYFYKDIQSGSALYDQRVKQGQYYAGMDFYLGEGFHITSAAHYIHYSLFSKQQNAESYFNTPDLEDNFYVAHLSLEKSIMKVNTSFGINYSNINNHEQLQGNLSLIYYPLGNLDLYTVTSAYLINERILNEKNNRYAVLQKAGFKATKWLWIEGEAILGEIKNMSMNNAFIIYNGFETITGKYDLSFILTNTKLNFRLQGSYQEYYSTLNDLQGISTTLNRINTNAISLTGGVSWKF